MKLSVVTSLYCSDQYIEDFYTQITHQCRRIVGDDYEIVMVNDGSPDGSLDCVKKLIANSGKIKLVDLSRNYGHHQALLCGLAYSSGDLIFLIDSDLEENPSDLELFYSTLVQSESDVVYGVQRRRKGSYFEATMGRIYYSVFRYLSGIDLPPNLTTMRLMTKRYVAALLEYEERVVNIAGLFASTGFKQTPLYIDKRASSPTTYTLQKKIDIVIDSVTSFSSVPLQVTFYFGCTMFVVALSGGIVLGCMYFLGAKPPSGYLSILLTNLLFSGFTLIVLGIQGIYLSKVFVEVKRRPRVVIKDIITHG